MESFSELLESKGRYHSKFRNFESFEQLCFRPNVLSLLDPTTVERHESEWLRMALDPSNEEERGCLKEEYGKVYMAALAEKGPQKCLLPHHDCGCHYTF